jgi:tRNA dimethylallyltransferase
MHAELSRVDPIAAARIHANDRKRIVRALEVFQLTGKPISEHHGQWGNSVSDSEPRHHALWLGLSIDRELLNRRINARCRAMFEAGWIDEVRFLLDRFGHLSPTASEAAGYSEIITALSTGRFEDALEASKISTRQLARRQIKWFRRFPDVHWIDATLPVDLQLQQARAFLN